MRMHEAQCTCLLKHTVTVGASHLFVSLVHRAGAFGSPSTARAVCPYCVDGRAILCEAADLYTLLALRLASRLRGGMALSDQVRGIIR